MTEVVILAVSLVILGVAMLLLRGSKRRREDATGILAVAQSQAEEVFRGKPLLRAEIEHKQDPVLRPLKLLVVQMPDADFEEVKAVNHEQPVDAVATTQGSSEAIADADFAVAVWPDGRSKVLKWRDYPTDAIEPEAYVPLD